MKKNTIVYTLLIIFLIVFLTFYSINNKYKNININHVRDSINRDSLPIIDNDNKYIELQTKEWIEKRENKEPCFGMLEKDKIIMVKWIEHFQIKGPKIHYYDYYYNFTLAKLKDIIDNNKGKRLVIKISHLQSNYGIIIIEPNINNDEIIKIYQKCIKLFDSCFVCNHDKNDSPNNKQIKNREKESYYKLYETVEPGIIIQDFFYSNKDKVAKPEEIKVLVFGDKIININSYILTSIDRMKLIFDKAREISALLGAHLIRVDFFVKKEDNPYIPYINEISLSPNGGMKKNWIISSSTLKEYKEEVKNYQKKDYKYINQLIKNAPYRTNDIIYYLSDADSGREKFAF
jgi:hypothetical protein